MFLSDGVGHHHKEQTFDQANGPPALFSSFDAVLHGDTERVEKYLAGFLKPHTMLAPSGAILCLVPLESNGDHAVIVIINL